MTGFDPAWSQKRPGKICMGWSMRQALAEQARELDLGRGAEGYKYELGALNRQNGRVILANRTRRSALAFTLTGWRVQGRALVRRSREASPPRRKRLDMLLHGREAIPVKAPRRVLGLLLGKRPTLGPYRGL